MGLQPIKRREVRQGKRGKIYGETVKIRKGAAWERMDDEPKKDL